MSIIYIVNVMRYSLTRTILENLVDSGKTMIDAFFPMYYPGTGPVRRLFGLDHIYYPSKQEAKRTISSILSRLQKEGLVKRAGPKKKATWVITKHGIRFLKKTRPYQYHNHRILPPLDNIVRLVTFDIPEKERWKRKWLHQELIACGFDSLHKSVFIGKRPLPDDFIQKIDELHLGRYIHIVAVTKSGTLVSAD